MQRQIDLNISARRKAAELDFRVGSTGDAHFLCSLDPSCLAASAAWQGKTKIDNNFELR